MTSSRKTAIIIGAGPAGLTAAYEFLKQTDILPIVIEASDQVGGISKTVNFKGNRIDIGGHRFFSKSERVTRWWLDVLPLQGSPSFDDLALDRKVAVSPDPSAPDPEKTDRVMLARSRLSRIYAFRKFFDYPISLTVPTACKLGAFRILRILFSYLRSRFFPIKPERHLEDFFINRFGRELYKTFFRSYTEKVWGLPCTKISVEWGAQRIKGLSISKAIVHAVKKFFVRKDLSLTQKGKETSLIEQFLYPKLGPGQLWEEVARRVEAKGGQILMNRRVTRLEVDRDKITGVYVCGPDGREFLMQADFVVSSMPVRDLISAMGSAVPTPVRKVAAELMYRDFITVGLLAKKVKLTAPGRNVPPDNWIYIQEEGVRLGRIQVFNNWSPYLVKDRDLVWLGLEYFCNEGDDFWSKRDADIVALASEELKKIGFIDAAGDLADGMVLRVPKTYPSYVGSYSEFETIRRFTDTIGNLFLIGRNGQHRYNNMDHSMLTAMMAVENISHGVVSKASIWAVNTEQEYHE